MKDLMKNALILCGITLVAGLLLGGVYEITKKPREKQIELSKQESYQKVIKEASSFNEMDVDFDEIKSILEERKITQKNVTVDKCIEALDEEGNIAGHVITVTSKEGYGGDITFSVGFNSENIITGISILSINETPGLGKNVEEDKFLDQYKQNSNNLYVVNKSPDSEGVNIDAISGATISSNAMTKGVNAAKITADYLLNRSKGDEVNE